MKKTPIGYESIPGADEEPITPVHAAQPPVASQDSDNEHQETLRTLFGDMLREPDTYEVLKSMIVQANADDEDDLMHIANKNQPPAFENASDVALMPGLLAKFWARLKVVKPENFVFYTHSGQAFLLREGTHLLKSPRQDYDTKVNKDASYSSCRDLHIIQVPRGSVGLAWSGNQPVLLSEGRHCLRDSRLRYDRIVVPITEPKICHGTINIIRVHRGCLGYATETKSDKPVILSEGLHCIDSQTFQFHNIIPLVDAQNTIGAQQLVRIETGQVGVAYKSGQLTILQPGLHLITPPDRFDKTVSTQMQVLHLAETVHDSADYVPLRVKADVFYTIKDPFLALATIFDIEQQIRETANATLAGIIRSSTLADIARSSKPAYEEEHDAAKAPSFYSLVHDLFIKQLYDHYRSKLGIELLNIRIEQLAIDDAELAKQISDSSLVFARTQARKANLEAERSIQETMAETAAAVEVRRADAGRETQTIKAGAEGTRVTIMADAMATETKLIAEAEATSRRTVATAEARAMEVRAEAEARASELRGMGTNEYAEQVGATKFGAEAARLAIQAAPLKGAQKVFYSGKLPDVWPGKIE